MTEAEWLACAEPQPMLDHMRGRISDRKLRLFAVACCRQVWHLLPDEQCRRAVEIAERYADGLARKKELAVAFAAIWPSVEKRLLDRVVEQDKLPKAREQAGMAAAAAAAVARGRTHWVDAWLALPPVEGVMPHSAPWDEAALALAHAAWDQVCFKIDVPSGDAVHELDAWSRAWEEADREGYKEVEAFRAWAFERLTESLRPGSRRTTGKRKPRANPVSPRAAGCDGNSRQPSESVRPCLPDFDLVYKEAHRNQCAVLRDLVGNPFHQVQVDPSWIHPNDSAVKKIARAIYQERQFNDMPILADALEEAGCDNEDILSHCRSEGLHVRGCWVVDLLLDLQ
jgi:hypothetical protein